MLNIERRIIALETKAHVNDSSLKLVFMQDGDTEVDAIKRAGYPENAANLIRVVFVSAADVAL